MYKRQVYILRCSPVGKDSLRRHNNFYVKVGVTSNLTKRISELQTGNPMPMSVIAVTGSMSKARAFSLESKLHGFLSEYSVVGEWFDFHAKRGGKFTKNKMSLNRIANVFHEFIYD